MKSKSTLRSFLILASSSLLAISYSHAASLYWDGGSADIAGNGNGLSLGTAGNWDTTIKNWDAGAVPYVAWNNANFDTAVFGGTAAAVTLGAPITVGGLSFISTSGYTIAAGVQGLTFGATNNSIRMINATNAATSAATVSGDVTGAGNVSLASINQSVASTLTLSGSAGGWNGTTTVNPSSTLLLTTSGASTLSTSGITLNGGRLQLGNGSVLERLPDAAPINANGGTLELTQTSGTNVYVETIGSVGLLSGQNNFLFSSNMAAAGSQSLTLSGLTRTGAANTSSVSFASASLLNPTKNMMFVTGASATTAGQILGPWATTGNTAGANDYAIYGAGGQVLPADATLTAVDETGWTASTNAYNNNVVTQTLTGTRTITALRNTAATATTTLATGANLETYGLLNGAQTLFTLAPGTGGTLTIPTGGGKLHLNAGNATTGGAIAISAPISDNGGAVTVVKDGLGTLTLSSTTNSFTGGTVVNAGSLTWTADTNLGSTAADRNITVNGNATLNGTGTSLNSLTVGSAGTANFTTGNHTFASASGSGTIVFRPSSATNRVMTLGDALNFTGDLSAQMGGLDNANPSISFTRIADTVGSALQFGGSRTDSNQAANMVISGDAGPLVFNNRRIEILQRTSTNHGIRFSNLVNNNSNVANTWVINTPLSYLANQQPRELVLNGSNTGDNAFNGLIGNGEAGGSITLAKNGAGRWILGNTANTYTGSTSIYGGTLQVVTVANSGVNSSIGAGGAIIYGNNTPNLGGGTLLINAATNQSTDRAVQIAGNLAGLVAIIESSGAGSVSFTNTAVVPNSVANQTRFFTFGGTNTGDNTFAGQINNNGTGVATISKAGAGKWILTNTNSSCTDTVFIQAGTLSVPAIQNATVSSPLGAGTLIALGRAADSGTLLYTGAAASTNRTIRIGTPNTVPGVGGGSILNDGTGALTFVATAFNTPVGGLTGAANSQNRILTLGGSYTGGANVIQGAIADNTASIGLVGLTKTGASTWTLSGTNTYTGPTLVSGGTLALVGGSQTSAITVQNAANLGFDISSPTTSTASVTLDSGHGIQVSGTPTLASYTLLTTTSTITGTPVLSPAIPGYTLVVDGGNTLKLDSTGAPVGYAAWQSANGTVGTRDQDHDNDGVDNGTEHFLGGTANTTGFTALPGVTNTLGTLSVTWTKATSYTGAYTTDFEVETSATLTGPWTPAVLGAGPDQVVISGPNVIYTFPAGTKNFARLKVTGP